MAIIDERPSWDEYFMQMAELTRAEVHIFAGMLGR